MTISYGTALLVIWIIGAHWVADFACQTRWQAENKSSNWEALGQHVATYSLIMTGFMIPALKVQFGYDFLRLAGFLAVTFIAHFVTDAITSRITVRLWDRRLFFKSGLRPFFIIVGFDQVLHYAQLFLTIVWLGESL